MLRQKLQDMTEVEDVTRHPELLKALSEECQNSIRLLQSPYPIDRYTCLMHVLDFVEKPEYVDIASWGLGRVYAGEEFAQWLLDHNKLGEVTQPEATDGDILFYFNGGKFKHAGIFIGSDRVTSKWGSGHLYEHRSFEAPVSYGDEVRAFKRPTYDDAYYFFIQFAK